MVNCLIHKKRKQVLLLVKTVFIMGMFALAGFFVAICIHADIRGDGNIINGINSIIADDVLRRTLGGDLNNFNEIFRDSFNASIWSVFKTYFHFQTEVITGIEGNLFPLVCLLPIAIFVLNYRTKHLEWEDAVLYGCCFITSVSWYILGKQHSQIHTHMNYVLWYFGYIQICFYVICKQIKNTISKGNAA